MATERAVLVIADIGGYTRFMNYHALNLAHAQEAVASLLEAIIDSAGALQVAKLEGDAVFFYCPDKDALSRLSKQIAAIRTAFLQRRQRLVIDRMCSCEGCMQIEQLNLKFVTHAGEVAVQKIKHHRELAGVSVILVHRMLKNKVPVPEYVLMTSEIHQGLEEDVRKFARPLTHDFEGIGPTETHYIDINEIAAELPAPLQPNWARRLWSKLSLEAGSVPYLLGIKKACDGFRNFPSRDEP